MWRYLVGAIAALLLAGGGMLWWRSSAVAERGHGRAVWSSPAEVAAAEQSDALPAPPVADEKTREEKRFARADRNKDGRISRDEYLALRRKNFAKLDRNGDGMLSFDEYATKAIDKFAAADKDHGGTLDPAEFAATRATRKAKPRANCPPAGRAEAKPDDDAN